MVRLSLGKYSLRMGVPLRLGKWIFAIVIFVALLGIWLYALLSPTVTQKSGMVYYLRPGISKVALIKELSAQNIVRYPSALTLFILPQANRQLKTGEYLFPQGSSSYTIWRQIINGKGFYMRAFTIIPGNTFQQIRKSLMQTEALRHVTHDLDDVQVMQLMGHPELAPEGQFFPETYYYTRGVQDLVILKRAFDLMQNRLQEAWATRASNLPYQTMYDALTAASLVEKEAYLDIERPIIASVIVNRLRKNMLLQIDPTVIYGLGDRYTGKLHKTDLLEDTYYNTYVHKGLPPTPIAMPGMTSIQAVMHPLDTGYYYFVARGDGSHQFSETLPEHNAAVLQSIKKKAAATTTLPSGAKS